MTRRTISRRATMMVVALLLIGACGSAPVASNSLAADSPTTELTTDPTVEPVDLAAETPVATPTPPESIPELAQAVEPSPTPVADPTPLPQPSTQVPRFVVDRDATYISYWTLTETTERRGIYYAMRSSDVWSEVYDDGERTIRVEVPFGMIPGYSFMRIWSPDSDAAAQPGPTAYWPVECLGVEPDIDGDSLLDDCDPYPFDGPLADYDADGILNPVDNCPTIFNPDQDATTVDRTPGLVCDSRRGAVGADFILDATATVDDINELRVAKGLEPIEWPVIDPVQSPAVAAWCQARATGTGEVSESREELLRSIPSEFGLTDSQLNEFFDLIEQISERSAELEAIEDSAQGGLLSDPDRYEAAIAELRNLRSDAERYIAPFEYSDQACNLHE